MCYINHLAATITKPACCSMDTLLWRSIPIWLLYGPDGLSHLVCRKHTEAWPSALLLSPLLSITTVSILLLTTNKKQLGGEPNKSIQMYLHGKPMGR